LEKFIRRYATEEWSVMPGVHPLGNVDVDKDNNEPSAAEEQN